MGGSQVEEIVFGQIGSHLATEDLEASSDLDNAGKRGIFYMNTF